MSRVKHIPYCQNQVLLFPPSIDENISPNDPVRLLDSIIDRLDLSSIEKLYKIRGRYTYDPRMMLKVILYAYMNNIYSCRKIEKLVLRDTHFIWLSGYQKPDFITINRFRNRIKTEIEKIFTQLVILLVELGHITLNVEYIDGTKIESKANKYTFVWRKSVEKNKEKLLVKIKIILEQVEECIAQDNIESDEGTPEITTESLSSIVKSLNSSLSSAPEPQTIEEKKILREKKKDIKKLEEHTKKLAEYNAHLNKLGNRNSYSKTDNDATFMRMKEDAMNNGQTKPGYNLQIGTENQFIVDYKLFANPTDTLTFIPFIDSFRYKFARAPLKVVADSGYGSEENYLFMDNNKIEGFVKYNYFHAEQKRTFKNDAFKVENLFYNRENDYYVCPMGQHMTYKHDVYRKSASGYISTSKKYEAQNCNACPLRTKCFKGMGNRKIEVNDTLRNFKQKARELLTSEEGLKHRSNRPIEPEAVFGQMKYNMAYRRFRHVGMDKVTMDFTFFAIAFNIKKLAAKIAKGLRNAKNQFFFAFLLTNTLKIKRYDTVFYFNQNLSVISF